MKALTVCQPNAHLIIHGDVKGELQRVENRSWRPPWWALGCTIVIRAGRIQKWPDTDDLPYPMDLVFGAAIGTVRILGWTHINVLNDYISQCPPHAWMANDRHVIGPWCFVLGNPMPLARPVPMLGNGARFFDVPYPESLDVLQLRMRVMAKQRVKRWLYRKAREFLPLPTSACSYVIGIGPPPSATEAEMRITCRKAITRADAKRWERLFPHLAMQPGDPPRAIMADWAD